MTVTETPERTETTPVDPEGGTCPRCDTPYDRYQEYCLECGLRLPLATGVVSRLHGAWTRRVPWYPGDWIWPVLLFLGIAALGATAAAIWAADEPTTERIVATTAIGTDETTTSVETVAPPAAPPPPPPATTAPAVPERPPPGALREWPANRNGYTVVLVSLPATGGRKAATTSASSTPARSRASTPATTSSSRASTRATPRRRRGSRRPARRASAAPIRARSRTDRGPQRFRAGPLW